MKLDVYQAAGTLGKSSWNGSGGAAKEGEASPLKVDISIVFQAKPAFLNDYLDGHNTGAQPSEVFWRTDPTLIEDASKFVRYHGIDKVVLAVPGKSKEFTVRIEPRRDPDDIGSLLPTAVLDACELKHLEVSFMKDGLAVLAKLSTTVSDKSVITSLAAVAQFDHQLVSMWVPQGDLLVTGDESPPPRPGTDAHEGAEPEAPKGPNEVIESWADEPQPGDQQMSVE